MASFLYDYWRQWKQTDNGITFSLFKTTIVSFIVLFNYFILIVWILFVYIVLIFMHNEIIILVFISIFLYHRLMDGIQCIVQHNFRCLINKHRMGEICWATSALSDAHMMRHYTWRLLCATNIARSAVVVAK